MGGLFVCLLALAGLLSSARATIVRPTASAAVLTVFFFLILITTIDLGMGIL